MRLVAWCLAAAGISAALDCVQGDPVSVGYMLLAGLLVGPFLAWLP